MINLSLLLPAPLLGVTRLVAQQLLLQVNRSYLTSNTHFWELLFGRGRCVCTHLTGSSEKQIDSTPSDSLLHLKSKAAHHIYTHAHTHTGVHTQQHAVFQPKSVSAVGTHIQSGANEITASCCDTDRRVSWEPISEAERHL